MEIHLETERLILRQFTLEDVDLLMELDSDPEVTRYINGGKPPEREKAQDFVEFVISGYAENPSRGFFIALEKPSLEFIGWFHYRPDRRMTDHMEIGYRLFKAAWGRGLATEGSKALIEDGFSRGIHKVSGCTLKANVPSQNVLRKIGLELVEEYEEQRVPMDDKSALLFARDFEA